MLGQGKVIRPAQLPLICAQLMIVYPPPYSYAPTLRWGRAGTGTVCHQVPRCQRRPRMSSISTWLMEIAKILESECAPIFFSSCGRIQGSGEIPCALARLVVLVWRMGWHNLIDGRTSPSHPIPWPCTCPQQRYPLFLVSCLLPFIKPTIVFLSSYHM